MVFFSRCFRFIFSPFSCLRKAFLFFLKYFPETL